MHSRNFVYNAITEEYQALDVAVRVGGFSLGVLRRGKVPGGEDGWEQMMRIQFPDDYPCIVSLIRRKAQEQRNRAEGMVDAAA